MSKNDSYMKMIPLEDDYQKFTNTIKDIQKETEKMVKNPNAKLNSILDKLRGSITRIRQETFQIASICYYLQETKIYKTKYKTFKECLEKEHIDLSRTTAIDFANIFRFIIVNHHFIKKEVLKKFGYRHFKTLAEKTKKLPEDIKINYLKKLQYKKDSELRKELKKLLN